MTIEDVVNKLGLGSDLSLEKLICEAMNSNAASHLKGVASELHLVNLAESSGCKIVKVRDSDLENRFDYHITKGDNVWTCECRMVTPKKRVSVSFRDSRFVAMPSGNTWRTHARNRVDDFDFLAINLFNLTGSMRDFVFLHKQYLPKYKIRKKDERFTIGDQIRMQEDFFDLSVKTENFCPPFSKTLKDVLSICEVGPIQPIQWS